MGTPSFHVRRADHRSRTPAPNAHLCPFMQLTWQGPALTGHRHFGAALQFITEGGSERGKHDPVEARAKSKGRKGLVLLWRVPASGLRAA